jgi:hypothetical protein
MPEMVQFVADFNDDWIARDAFTSIGVWGGTGPFDWTVTGTDFTLQNAQTAGRTNGIKCTGVAGATEEVTVTDANLNEVTFFVSNCTASTCLDCAADQISFTTQLMGPSEQQVLSVDTPLSDASCYTWAITSGVGSLDTAEGLTVTYTAPATNAGCDNPTIVLYCDGIASDTLQIAINTAPIDTYEAMIFVRYDPVNGEQKPFNHGGFDYYAGVEAFHTHLWCDGSVKTAEVEHSQCLVDDRGPPTAYGGCYVYPPTENYCYQWCGAPLCTTEEGHGYDEKLCNWWGEAYDEANYLWCYYWCTTYDVDHNFPFHLQGLGGGSPTYAAAGYNDVRVQAAIDAGCCPQEIL